MKTKKQNEYNKIWMRNFRKKKREERLLSQGKCPVCEILLTSKYHTSCSYLKKQSTQNLPRTKQVIVS